MIQLAHTIIREQLRKYKAGYKSPTEIDNALYRGLLDFYNSLFSANDSQQLSRYVKEQVCNISSTNVFAIGADFNRPIIIKSIVGALQYEGEILAENEWLDRLNSVILEPDLQHPIARITGISNTTQNIEFYPSDAGNFVLVYYRSPTKPVYNYTVAVNGRDITFNPTGSVDLDVHVNSINNVIVRAIAYLGISLKDESSLLERQNAN